MLVLAVERSCGGRVEHMIVMAYGGFVFKV